MTPSMVGLILTLVGAAFLIVGIFWGLIRGLKKSLFRGLWIFGVALITFFLTPVISRALCNMDLSFLSISVDGEPVKSVFETLRTILYKQEMIVDVLNNNPTLLPLVEQVIILVINIIVFPVSFWITKIVTYPIWVIISAIIFKKKKTVVNGKHMLVKPKKHRIAGMGLGLVSGIMVMVITLMPFIGTVNLVKKIDSLDYSASENGDGIITANVGAETMEYVDAYSDSVLGKALKYSGIEYLTNSMYDFLATKKIDDQKVTLSRELELYVTLMNDLDNIQKTDFEHLTQDTMSAFLNSSENIVKKLFSSALLKIAGKDLIPYAVSYLENNESFMSTVDSIAVEEFKTFALESVDKFKETTVNELQQDVLNTIYVAKALNDGNILVPTIYNQLEAKDYLPLFTDTVVDQVTKYMFKMPSVNKVYPKALDASFMYFSKVLGFNYTSKDYVETSMTQEDVANVLKGGFAVARSIDMDSAYYITKASFKSTGKFMDTLKNLNVLQDGLFENILDKLVEKAKDEISKMDQSEEIEELIGRIIDKFEGLIVNKQVLLETELEQYGILFDDVKAAIDEFSTADKKQLVLANYGKLLDKLNETEILKEIMPDILEAGWDSIKGGLLDALKDFANLEPIANGIMDNIVLVLENQHVKDPVITSDSNIQLSLEVEFREIQNLYNFIVNNMMHYFEQGGSGADGLQDDLFGETSTLAIDLGEEFDAIKNNLIVTPTVVRNLMAEVFTTVKEGLASNARAQKFIDDIVVNMKTFTTGVTWAEELKHIKTLANYARQDGFDINTLGVVLDEVCQSRFIGFALINDLIQEEMQAQYDALAPEIKTDTSDAIILGIKDNISKISSQIYEEEINYMLDFIDMIEDMNAVGGMTYTQMGILLDSFNDSDTISSVRPNIICYAIEDKIKTETDGTILYAVLMKIKENALTLTVRPNDTFYARQFAGIDSVAGLTFPANKDDLTRDSLAGIGNAFFDISNTYDYAMVYNLGDVVIDKIIDQIDYADLVNVVASLRTNITDETDGVMVNNRRPSDSSRVEQVRVKYVACFTDLYDLSEFYTDADNLIINENTDASVLGGYLDSIQALTIVKDEVKEIASIIMDKFEQSGKATIRAKKDKKIEDLEKAMVDAPPTEVEYQKGRVVEVAAEYEYNFVGITNIARTTIANNTTATYTEMFTKYISDVKDLINNVDIALNNVIPL